MYVSNKQEIKYYAYDAHVVLGHPIGEPLCAKSTIQLFRDHLLIHGKNTDILKTSINEAKAPGLIQRRSLVVALDTTPILGRGVVQNTYNLPAQAMSQLLLQDVESFSNPDDGEPGAKVKHGIPAGLIPSATDPQQCHGRTSVSTDISP